MSAPLPEQMRCVEIKAPGGPEELVPSTRATPVPGPDEVLIKTTAAGVNRPDVLQRRGLYPVPPGASDLPGLEVAGTIAAWGANVTGYDGGEAVCALVPGGGYAEYVTTPAPHCLPIPTGLGHQEAAALPENYFTVWHNVFDRGALQAGEVLLVHGGASGIGTTAIQMAQLWGARVFTTAGTEAKCALCRELGADLAINYREQDFAAAIQEHTGQAEGGVDVVLDMVGGDYITPNLKILNPDGRYVFIAFQGGSRAQVDFGPLMRRRLTVTGSTLRPQSAERKARIAAGLLRWAWPQLNAGAMKPILTAVMPLEQAADAHRLMESGELKGKIVLDLATTPVG
mgnify:FL=1